MYSGEDYGPVVRISQMKIRKIPIKKCQVAKLCKKCRRKHNLTFDFAWRYTYCKSPFLIHSFFMFCFPRSTMTSMPILVIHNWIWSMNAATTIACLKM